MWAPCVREGNAQIPSVRYVQFGRPAPVRSQASPRHFYPGPYCIATWAAYRVIRRAQPETSAQRLVENLQRQVSRLEDENQRLRSDLLAAGVEVEEDQTKEVQGGLETGPFAFPKARCIVAFFCKADAHVYREAEGDWISLFRNAAPYIAAFRGGTVVLHLPSFILEDEMRETFRGLMEDVAFCSLLGLQMVLVTSIECRLLKRLADKGRLTRDSPATKVCRCVAD
eukprot:symbB.v1.2.036309.t1/scaffold5098.1/size30972/1